MPELADEVHARVQALCQEADGLVEVADYVRALELYWEAWFVLPEPRTEWDAATWILGAVGDANFACRDYVAARDNFAYAMRCPGAVGNGFLHLRLGQCELELGDESRAVDELARAFMAGGRELFEGEDPRYYTFLKARLDAPVGGW